MKTLIILSVVLMSSIASAQQVTIAGVAIPDDPGPNGTYSSFTPTTYRSHECWLSQRDGVWRPTSARNVVIEIDTHDQGNGETGVSIRARIVYANFSTATGEWSWSKFPRSVAGWDGIVPTAALSAGVPIPSLNGQPNSWTCFVRIP